MSQFHNRGRIRVLCSMGKAPADCDEILGAANVDMTRFIEEGATKVVGQVRECTGAEDMTHEERGGLLVCRVGLRSSLARDALHGFFGLASFSVKLAS